MKYQEWIDSVITPKLYIIMDDLNRQTSLWCSYPNGRRECIHTWKLEWKEK